MTRHAHASAILGGVTLSPQHSAPRRHLWRGVRRSLGRSGAAAVLLLALSGCGSAPGIDLPPAGGTPDYQLGGAYDPAPEVTIVGRDRSADPAPGVYSICYVNGFQTQPGELDVFPGEALLRGQDGKIRFDPDWPDEALLDTSTAERRAAILAVISPWVEGCARDGFDAVEFDNLDSYTRSGGVLTRDHNLALASELVRVAHGAGLAAGQKNAAEDAAVLQKRAGFDFAVTEECSVFSECPAYTDVYGEHVIDIEYTDELPRPFSEMCADPDAPGAMVLRDRLLSVPGDPDYAFTSCPR